MTILMNDSHLITLGQLEEFLKGNGNVDLILSRRKEKYQFISDTVIKFKYCKLGKKGKSLVKQYLIKLTGYSDIQTKRLIARQRDKGKIETQYNSEKKRKNAAIYTPEDIATIAKTSNAHAGISGPALKHIFQRGFTKFKDNKFFRLQFISIAHIYNLMATRQYRSLALHFTKTNPIKNNIGIRMKPAPFGKPGYLRVDTVHQGDLDKQKGVYHINLVDEVTQYEIIGCAEGISEQFLRPLLEKALAQFPFVIINFHSDNGSEFLNRRVEKLLNNMLIKQTKSRSRHCNDNALVEGKNAAVVRRWTGHIHIPKKYAPAMNDFYQNYFNDYLNFHRPCGFATTIIDKKGKQKKIYKQENYMTPYEKFKTLENWTQYFAPGRTEKQLDDLAYLINDNQSAVLVQEQKKLLFQSFKY